MSTSAEDIEIALNRYIAHSLELLHSDQEEFVLSKQDVAMMVEVISTLLKIVLERGGFSGQELEGLAQK